MPLYDFECTKCGHVQEEFFGMNDKHSARCAMCGAKSNKLPPRGVGFTGDLPTLGNYSYYDHSMGVQIHSRQHREDEMKKRNLREYSPDPEYSGAVSEMKYIKKHARPSDDGAQAAITKIGREAGKSRRSRVNKSIERKMGLPR